MRTFGFLMALGLCAAAFAAERGPRFLKVEPSARRVGRFDLFELTVRLDAAFDNPYDPDQIVLTATFTGPDGTAATVNGFIYQDYERKLEDGKEKLIPRGERVWKVRFAPQSLGTYRYRLTLKTRDGMATDPGGSFECVPSKNPGFVRVSRRNPRYFEFSTGKPFFPIGHNVCWADSQLKTYDYERYFRKMAAAGENFTRIWMCSWSLELEGQRLDDYRLDNAWRLDHILRFARLYGIYCKLCFDNYYDFTQKRHSPYWRDNGGMCLTPRDFFTDPEARKHYLRRIRYIVARWGYSTQVMAWELWNEMDYAPSEKGKVLSQKEPYMLDWTVEMAGHLRRLDPFGHLVTNTLAAYTDWPQFWLTPATDFVQVHAYIYLDWEPNPHQYDAAALVLDLAQDFRQFPKPLLIAEFGYHRGGGMDRLSILDKTGIHLHNALWASALGGAAGSPMLWWWDDYVDPNDLYYHYRALARFLDRVDLPGKAWQPVRREGADNLRVVGLRTRSEALLWFQDKRNTWQTRLLKSQPPRLLADFTFELGGLEPGEYRLRWFDTYDGYYVTETRATSRDGTLPIRLPSLIKAPDVACRVEPLP